MATRQRKEAVTGYLTALSEITACYAGNVSFVQRSSPDVVDAIVVSPAREDSVPLRDQYGAVRLALAVTLHYVVEEVLNVPAVRTVAYQYVLETTAEPPREILRYDWHPHVEGITFPHLHVLDGFQSRATVNSRSHLPTGFVTIHHALLYAERDHNITPLSHQHHHAEKCRLAAHRALIASLPVE